MNQCTEKRISVEEPAKEEGAAPTKIEYRVWNPFRSKLAAGIMGGIDELGIAPGKKFYTWVLLPVLLFPTLLMLLVQKVWFMPLNSLIVQVEN